MPARFPRPLGVLLAVAAGFVFFKLAFAETTMATAWAVSSKLRGKAPGCEWNRVLSFHADFDRFHKTYQRALGSVSQSDSDDSLGIIRVSSPKRAFWVRRAGSTRDGAQLIAYLLAEHTWMVENNPAQAVRPGDIVLDCGAHVGVFTHQALEAGAARVVAIEPDPVHLECLRRNFAAEIAQGRVSIVPKGVWSSDKTLTLHLGVGNSGMNSVVKPQGGGSVEVPVTTIDQIACELGLPRVDYIKMDIEGAEREALQGGMATLRRHRPRLMLDSYHRPDDLEVLPALIRRAHPGYATTCGPCEPHPEDQGHLVPHFTYYQ